jgi:hypothetical protein
MAATLGIIGLGCLIFCVRNVVRIVRWNALREQDCVPKESSFYPESGSAESVGGKLPWKYLRVLVEPGPGSERGEKVNIRVPMKLIRAGLKWVSLIPKQAQGDINKALQDKGIDLDFSKIKPEDLQDILTNLDELTVDVDGHDKVRIFCE